LNERYRHRDDEAVATASGDENVLCLVVSVAP